MEKTKELLKSRKFYALLLALAVIWLGVATGANTVAHAIDQTITALGIYTGGVGLENIGASPAIVSAIKSMILSQIEPGELPPARVMTDAELVEFMKANTPVK